MWIVWTVFSDQFKDIYTIFFWKWLGNGICKQFDTRVFISMYPDDI